VDLSLYEGKIVSQGFSARNYGEVPDGNYEIEYIFEGRTINKRITIVRGRRVSDQQRLHILSAHQIAALAERIRL